MHGSFTLAEGKYHDCRIMYTHACTLDVIGSTGAMDSESVGWRVRISPTGSETPGITGVCIEGIHLTKPISPGLIGLFVNNHIDRHLVPCVKTAGTIGNGHVLAIEVEGGAGSGESIGQISRAISGGVRNRNRMVIVTGLILPESN